VASMMMTRVPMRFGCTDRIGDSCRYLRCRCSDYPYPYFNYRYPYFNYRYPYFNYRYPYSDYRCPYLRCDRSAGGWSDATAMQQRDGVAMRRRDARRLRVGPYSLTNDMSASST
jgi:hypothetical protein